MPDQQSQLEVPPPGPDQQDSLDREVPAWVHRGHKRLPPWLRWLLGCALILLGILGIILPIIPGWIFLIPGIFLIGRDTALTGWLVKRILMLRRRLRLWKEARARTRGRKG